MESLITQLEIVKNKRFILKTSIDIECCAKKM